MTTPIRIPVHVSDGNFRWHCHAAERDDLARKLAEAQALANAAITGQRSLHTDHIGRWDTMRDAVLHGLDGFDNDQTNTVLSCIDDHYPSDIKPCNHIADTSKMVSDDLAKRLEAAERKIEWLKLKCSGTKAEEMQILDAIDFAEKHAPSYETQLVAAEKARDVARAEADAAKAEVAALKAVMIAAVPTRDACLVTDYSEGFNMCRAHVIDSYRAAGIEVVGNG